MSFFHAKICEVCYTFSERTLKMEIFELGHYSYTPTISGYKTLQIPSWNMECINFVIFNLNKFRELLFFNANVFDGVI